MFGFETIGNATLIAYDGDPILATDPWIAGPAYFGSWGPTHQIPSAQLDAIQRARFLWFSHGHPDHLNVESLDRLKGRQVLVSDHKGSRIAEDLRELGFAVRVLPTKQWERLSPRIRVQSIPDYNQDSVLLVELGDELVLNLNDASARGWDRYVREIAGNYRQVWLLRINGYGDATMINYFDEEGTRITPPQLPFNRKRGMGARAQEAATKYGGQIVVPFSFFHQYQREDSDWANEWVAPLAEFDRGLDPSSGVQLTEAFVHYDCEKRELTHLTPELLPKRVYAPEEFGDDWSEELSDEDRKAVRDYFVRRQELLDGFRFVNVRVGGKDHTVDLHRDGKWGVTLELPRGSLMKTLEWEVFDDLFIGNYMKTTLHGDFKIKEFKPKLMYADQRGAYTRDELDAYFEHYRKLFPFEFMRNRVVGRADDLVRNYLEPGSLPFRAAKRAIRVLR